MFQYIKNVLYTKRLKKYLTRLTHKIGNIFIDSEKIICFVNQEKLNKYGKGNFSVYKLQLNGLDKTSKKFVHDSELDKSFFYIFENIDFSHALLFNSKNAHIHFKKCTFSETIGIPGANEVTFENNRFIDSHSIYYHGWNFFNGKFKRLTFVNENFVNSYEKDVSNKFGIDVDVEKLEIINSKIDITGNGLMKVKAKEVNIDNSYVSAPEILIDSPTIIYNGTQVSFNDGNCLDNARSVRRQRLLDLRDFILEIVDENLEVKEEKNNYLVKK